MDTSGHVISDWMGAYLISTNSTGRAFAARADPNGVLICEGMMPGEYLLVGMRQGSRFLVSCLVDVDFDNGDRQEFVVRKAKLIVVNEGLRDVLCSIELGSVNGANPDRIFPSGSLQLQSRWVQSGKSVHFSELPMLGLVVRTERGEDDGLHHVDLSSGSSSLVIR